MTFNYPIAMIQDRNVNGSVVCHSGSKNEPGYFLRCVEGESLSVRTIEPESLDWHACVHQSKGGGV